ncbi:MAG: hypothetical protein AAF942_09850 [Pseudomonadota bacterium]
MASQTALTQERIDSLRRKAMLPPIDDRSMIRGLEAQVEDLKYTLSNILQGFAESPEATLDSRQQSLLEDARAALNGKPADYID